MSRDRFIGEVWAPSAISPSTEAGGGATRAPAVGAIPPRDAPPPPNIITIAPGTTMAEIERLAIQAALKETRGNRRRASEMLGIGERTLYRKIREYKLPEGEYVQ